MSKVKQEVIWYRNYESIATILQDMRERIEDGWRVHACLNKSSDVLVVYEVNL
jgi:hypothetical protein